MDWLGNSDAECRIFSHKMLLSFVLRGVGQRLAKPAEVGRRRRPTSRQTRCWHSPQRRINPPQGTPSRFRPNEPQIGRSILLREFPRLRRKSHANRPKIENIPHTSGDSCDGCDSRFDTNIQCLIRHARNPSLSAISRRSVRPLEMRVFTADSEIPRRSAISFPE